MPSSRFRRPVWDDDEPRAQRIRSERVRYDYSDTTELPAGSRWSTWDQVVAGSRGPAPHPDWLVTQSAAVDTDLGLVKTGKEADVLLVERAVPDGPGCLLASKRYRASEHRLFHRDAGYLEGRRVRESRMTRAMANRTTFGRRLIADQWAAAEFVALVRLWTAGVPVPYPVQVNGTELLMEFLGDPNNPSALDVV